VGTDLHCNIIEAPWLVNGGHGASLRHHKVGSPVADAPLPCADDVGQMSSSMWLVPCIQSWQSTPIRARSAPQSSTMALHANSTSADGASIARNSASEGPSRCSGPSHATPPRCRTHQIQVRGVITGLIITRTDRDSPALSYFPRPMISPRTRHSFVV
jgi:hypothetical protein